MASRGLTQRERMAVERAVRVLIGILRRSELPMCLVRLLDAAEENLGEALIMDEIVFKSDLATRVRKAAAAALRRCGKGMEQLEAETHEFWRMVPDLVEKALRDDKRIAG